MLMGPRVKNFLLFLKIAPLTCKQKVPINLVAVKIRAVNTGEPGCSAN